MNLNEAFPTLENNTIKQLIKYAVMKTMFCPYSKVILDMRTCIMIDIETVDGKPVLNQVIAPGLVDKLQAIKDNVLKQSPTHVVKFYSSNKKSFKGNQLINLI